MSRLSHHANARTSVSTSRSQPLPSSSQLGPSGKERAYYQRLGSQGSEMQDYHVPVTRSRPSSGHSLHSIRAPRTPPAKLSYMDSSNLSPSFQEYEAPDVHNLRTGTFSFGRPGLRPTSGGVMSPAHMGANASFQRMPKTAPDNPLAHAAGQAGQARPPTPLEPQTTHIRAWLHRLETSVNSIRHEFESFRASTDVEKDSRLLMKDAMSSTLEACRQIPQILQTQHDDHARKLASELQALVSQTQNYPDSGLTKKLGSLEQKLVDLERRMSMSNAMLSSRIEEVKAAVQSQASLMHQGLTATASLEDRIARMLEADRKERGAAFKALHRDPERCEQVKSPETSDEARPRSTLDCLPSVHSRMTASLLHKASHEDMARANCSSLDKAAMDGIPGEHEVQRSKAYHTPFVTYGKNNCVRPANSDAGKPCLHNDEPAVQKPPRKRQRTRASGYRKRKRPPSKPKSAAPPLALPLDETGVFAIPVPEQKPRPRKSDSRKRFASSIFTIPSRFPP